MTLTRTTSEQLLADIQKRFEQGHTEATAERVKSIAARESDPQVLRKLVAIACDALIAPPVKKPRKRPPAKTLVVTKDGAADLDATPPMTAREQLRYLKDQARDHAIFEQVEGLEGSRTKEGAFAEVAHRINEKNPKASITEIQVRNAYYRIKNRPSLKV